MINACMSCIFLSTSSTSRGSTAACCTQCAVEVVAACNGSMKACNHIQQQQDVSYTEAVTIKMQQHNHSKAVNLMRTRQLILAYITQVTIAKQEKHNCYLTTYCGYASLAPVPIAFLQAGVVAASFSAVFTRFMLTFTPPSSGLGL